MHHKARNRGISVAVLSATFMGFIPIFGKQSLIFGFSPLAVVALRSLLAALLLAFIIIVFRRNLLYIYPVGIYGCALAGFFNGIGSILYYSAQTRLDAGVGHMLYSLYPLFTAFWLMVDSQPLNKITVVRIMLSIPAVYLMVHSNGGSIDIIGVLLMLGAALFYALHLIINQRILFEAPAPTVTLYTLIAMGVTTSAAFLIFSPQLPKVGVIWLPAIGMGILTFLSRITLFLGVKRIGGMQTALLGLAELIVTLILAHVWLGEKLALSQWLGASLLSLVLIMVIFDHHTPQRVKASGILSWLNPPSIRPQDAPWR
jgi:drug/metabolite transporter (DMT)-like permease